MPTDDEMKDAHRWLARDPGREHLWPQDDAHSDAAWDAWLIEHDERVRAEAVAAERERCARIAGAETDFTDVIHAEAHRRYPVDHAVDDPFGATGEARSDPYGYDEYARGAFLAGAFFQHENERTRRLQDAAAIRADAREETDHAGESEAVCAACDVDPMAPHTNGCRLDQCQHESFDSRSLPNGALRQTCNDCGEVCDTERTDDREEDR